MFSKSLKILLGLNMAEGKLKEFSFAISLLDATIQDGSKRERSDVLGRLTDYFTDTPTGVQNKKPQHLGFPRGPPPWY